jgi:L-lactate dehydrogenase (cytochrome)/(S)-mandelate dehydrogenase
MRRIDRAVTIEDLRRLAIRRLPHFIGAYVERGAGDGGGVRRNVEAFRRYRFVPRALVDVTPVDTSVELFGRTYASCFGISAVGMAGMYRRHADEMLASAAREANLPFILSGSSTASIETITRIAPDHTWYQLYAAKTPGLTDDHIGRARDAGVQVLVFTVDYPVQQRSEVVSRTGLSLARGPTLKSLPRFLADVLLHPGWLAEWVFHGVPRLESWSRYAPAGSTALGIHKFVSEQIPFNQLWTDLERIRRRWHGKLIVKGLVHPQDVLRAVAAGVDGVTISNHGGNKLDCMQSALESLATVRADVEQNIRLFFDGGIRRGSDILVAKALGATHCFVGRATLYGVTAGGDSGVRRALEILQTDLAYTMAMIGCKRIAEVTPAVLAGNNP